MYKDENSLLCICKGIKYTEVIKAIKDRDLKTLDEVMNCTKAGISCWSCRGDIKDLLEEYNKTGDISVGK